MLAAQVLRCVAVLAALQPAVRGFVVQCDLDDCRCCQPSTLCPGVPRNASAAVEAALSSANDTQMEFLMKDTDADGDNIYIFSICGSVQPDAHNIDFLSEQCREEISDELPAMVRVNRTAKSCAMIIPGNQRQRIARVDTAATKPLMSISYSTAPSDASCKGTQNFSILVELGYSPSLSSCTFNPNASFNQGGRCFNWRGGSGGRNDELAKCMALQPPLTPSQRSSRPSLLEMDVVKVSILAVLVGGAVCLAIWGIRSHQKADTSDLRQTLTTEPVPTTPFGSF